MDPTAQFENSTLRERVVEHVFVGEALRNLWRRGAVDVEVLRSEFDAHGYDLVLAHGRIVRHIQFKSGTSKKPGDISVSLFARGKTKRLRAVDSSLDEPRNEAVLLVRQRARGAVALDRGL